MRRQASDLVGFGCQNETTEIVMSTSTLIATPAAAQNEHATLFVGFELGKTTWLIGLYAPELGRTVSRYKIDGGDLGKVLELIAAMRRRLEKLGKPVRVVSIYEAGYVSLPCHRCSSSRERCGHRRGVRPSRAHGIFSARRPGSLGLTRG